jgi:prevent-host-death family protein
MNAVTLKEAKRNLEQLVEQVIADAEPTIVVADSGEQVVIIPLDSTTPGRKPSTCWEILRSGSCSRDEAGLHMTRLVRDIP